MTFDSVAEWLRRWIANPLLIERASSNLATVAKSFHTWTTKLIHPGKIPKLKILLGIHPGKIPKLKILLGLLQVHTILFRLKQHTDWHPPMLGGYSLVGVGGHWILR